MDPPVTIVEECIARHCQMIKVYEHAHLFSYPPLPSRHCSCCCCSLFLKELNGLPGARADRLKSAQTVRHCALSLVGEPIMVSRKQIRRIMHVEVSSSFL